MYVDMSILRGCFGHDGTAVYIVLVKQNKRP
jgi:hypothetical protein